MHGRPEQNLNIPLTGPEQNIGTPEIPTGLATAPDSFSKRLRRSVIAHRGMITRGAAVIAVFGAIAYTGLPSVGTARADTALETRGIINTADIDVYCGGPCPTPTKKPHPTATRIPPTHTKVPPTETKPPKPTETKVPPTNTKVPPTETKAAPTETKAPPTETKVPPTNTKVPPSETSVPPTETLVPPTETPVPPTSTKPPEATLTLTPNPSHTPVPPTETPVPPTPKVDNENHNENRNENGNDNDDNDNHDNGNGNDNQDNDNAEVIIRVVEVERRVVIAVPIPVFIEVPVEVPVEEVPIPEIIASPTPFLPGPPAPAPEQLPGKPGAAPSQVPKGEIPEEYQLEATAFNENGEPDEVVYIAYPTPDNPNVRQVWVMHRRDYEQLKTEFPDVYQTPEEAEEERQSRTNSGIPALLRQAGLGRLFDSVAGGNRRSAIHR